MKKTKKKIIILLAVLVVLLFPIPSVYKDGGTRTYTSLTYKIIVWHKMKEPNGYKTGTEIYFFPNNFHDLDYYVK